MLLFRGWSPKLLSIAFALLALLLGGCATTAPQSPPPQDDAAMAKSHFNRAVTLVGMGGHAAEAEAEFRQALELNPNDPEAFTQFARLLMDDQQRLKEAVDLLQRAATLDRENWRRWAMLALGYWTAEDSDGAIASATRAIDLNHDSAPSYYVRGTARNLKDDIDGALADFREAERLDPKKWDCAYWVGRMLAAKKDWNGAIAEFTRAIELDPSIVYAYVQRGEALRKLKKYEEALADLKLALERESTNAGAWDSRGDVLVEMERLPEAIAAYAKAMELDPTFMFYALDRGKARLKAGDLDGAITDFDEASRRDPQSDLPYYRRAQAKEQKEDIAGAEADFSMAIKLGADDDTNWRGRGTARYVLGDFRGALADLEESDRRDADQHSYDKFWCYQLRQRMGETTDRAILLQIVQKETDPWIQAIARFLAGETTEEQFFASTIVGEERKAAGRQCEAFYYAGMVRLLRGDPGSRELLQKCAAMRLVDFYEYKLAKGELARMGK